MIPLLRAEVRKLFTIRSTYVIFAVSMLLLGFVSFWVFGYKDNGPGGVGQFEEIAATSSTIIAVFIAITATLMVAHEYRYNTIMYTLTAANSRTKVLLAKIAVASAYAVAATLFAMVFAVAMLWLGNNIAGSYLPPQEIHYWPVIWHSVFFVWGYTMVGLLVAALFRHVVGAIVVLLIVPATIEGLLELVLKSNAKYLPFHALEQVHTGAMLSHAKGALVFGAYLVSAGLITWYLFTKRDAN